MPDAFPRSLGQNGGKMQRNGIYALRDKSNNQTKKQDFPLVISFVYSDF